MALALIRPGQIYAWLGSSFLLLDTQGECGGRETLSGYYFREGRFLSTLRLEINGRSPWPCDAALLEPHRLAFTYVHPQLTEFGGGGSGQSGDETSTDADGIPHRALSLRVVHALHVDGLIVSLTITNHSSVPSKPRSPGLSTRTSRTSRKRTEANASSTATCAEISPMRG